MQDHLSVFRGTSMESSSTDSLLALTTDWRLPVAESDTCRSAEEICLSSLRCKRTGVISKPCPPTFLSLPSWDCICICLYSGIFIFLETWSSEDEEGEGVCCPYFFRLELLFWSVWLVCIFVYVGVICVLVCTFSVCIWVLFALACNRILCNCLSFWGWSSGCTVPLRSSLSFFLSCRLELL